MTLGIVEVHELKAEVCEVPQDLCLQVGDTVVIEDEDGEDVGRLVAIVEDDEGRGRILRHAQEQDIINRKELDSDRPRLVATFARLRDEYGLDMRLVGAHWRLDRRRVFFYFASEDRLDFRLLHKALASALAARVTIRQIGVRDHARMLGGLGSCGREVCCRAFMRDLKPIALRMARQQSLFVEPSKISGLCGKLLCCLGFEDETYRQFLREMPRAGDRVITDHGHGAVAEVDVLKRRLIVRLDDGSQQLVALEETSAERGNNVG